MSQPDLMSAQVLARLSFVEREAPDPAAWVEEELGETLWSKQREIFEALRIHRRVSVPACHSAGKSFVAGRAIAHFGASYPVDDVAIVFSAPSQSQVNAIVGRELRKVHRKAGLPGRIVGGPGQPLYWMVGDVPIAQGRRSASAADSEQAAAAMQGIHARHVLVVLDEAGGCDPWMWDAAEALMTNPNARLLAIGNPSAGSRFEKVSSPGSGWHVVPIPASETPNFTGEDVPADVAEQLVSREWVDEVTETYGADSAYVTARVHARFPTSRHDTLIDPAWITAAQNRDLAPGMVATPGVLSADVARSGGDRTVVYSNRGGVVRKLHEARGEDLMVTTGRVRHLLHGSWRGGSVTTVVDEAGLGGGVVDRLREQRVGVVAFNGAHSPRDGDRFVNRRAETFWSLREAFRAGEIDLDPRDRDLAKQLGQLRWSLDSRGRIKIESKDDMRARGVGSPDHADAVAMSVSVGAWRPLEVLDEWEILRRRVAAAERARAGVMGPVSFEEWASRRGWAGVDPAIPLAGRPRSDRPVVNGFLTEPL